MKNPLVSIVILNWNNSQDTIQCIKSLSKIHYSNWELIVVDNNSSDDGLSNLKKLIRSHTFIQNKKNLGFTGGCNVGISHALKGKSKYILLLNNDTIVDQDFLTHLVATSIKLTNKKICGPKIYYMNEPEVIWFAGGYINYKNGPFRKKYELETDNSKNSKTQKVDYINGCCMLIPRKLFQEVGLLDEDYFAYVEDVDLCIRAKSIGYDCIFEPKSKIWHSISSSGGGEGNLVKEYLKSRNLILFGRKNLSGTDKFNYLFSVLRNRTKDGIDTLLGKEYFRAMKNLHGLIVGIMKYIR